ncbi:putative acetoacetyl-coenzyme A synthetase [Podospora australis]|uniref:Acetoacetyl-coenzyme A synthetase n=1 Tax=Podospora australis TaxID=1536484 RepID=A0AAN6X3Q0_9PEZI|nr:putative acetoacetyl-coenzyme A synthetase [Podospora australis]
MAATEEQQHPVVVPRKLWEHPDPESTLMWSFMQGINRKHGLQLKTFWDLHAFSLENRSEFWAEVLEAANFISEGTYAKVVDESAPVDAVPRWFEGVKLSFAENMLFSRDPATGTRTTKGKEDDRIAVTEVREGGSETREVTYGELRKRAGELAAAMRAQGVERGDRVVIVGANSVETLLVWLATSWLGAVFSSSSTDMGTKGILQRAVQVDPRWVFMDDAALYNGKVVDLRQKMGEVVEGLEEGGCRNFKGVVSIRRFNEARDVSSVQKAVAWEDFLKGKGNKKVPEFVRIAFHEPLLVCYSSGTTGMPKAIVHSVGGIMVNYFKEGCLHEGLGAESVTLQYTTTGWIMYLANVGALMFGGRSIFYDGSPFQPDAKILVQIAAEHGATKLGISPRWLFELSKAGLSPRKMADLSKLKVVSCTGMVLSEQLFEWFYDVGFPSSVQLGNISGGTDIAGCFGIMNPLTPVYVGGTQGPSLGISVAIYDNLAPEGSKGVEVPHGTPGELVATTAFPNVPCSFWGDKTPVASPGSKYHSAYFARFQNVWAHGDFCVIHPVTKNIAFLGRADGVLNPSGVRFGSAEVYGVIERWFADRIQDSLCVGQRRAQDNDESVMLFLLMKPGRKFDRKLAAEVKDKISKDLSKRHVPRYIFETPEIPTTINLKKVELPVKQIVSGQTIKASGTLANPQSLDFYYQFAKVEELVGPKEKL